jgi:hypothetical protein
MLHESDAVAGVHAICTTKIASSFSSSTSSFDWLRAAELSASGNYEAAIELLLKNKNNDGDAGVVVGAEAYAALHDWQGLQQWIKVRLFKFLN